MRCALCVAICLAGPALADPAVIEGVEVRASSGGYGFSVTLRHGDTGWDDYADGWRVEAADGTVLGYRELLHPHVNEQPFTRSLNGVAIPEGMREVFVRSRTNVDGWDTSTVRVDLE